MAGLGELAELLDVHVQQVAGARPQIAHDRRRLWPRPPRAAAPAQDLMDRGVRPANLLRIGEPPRTPARLLAQRADRSSLLLGHLGRGPVRPAGALTQTHQ